MSQGALGMIHLRADGGLGQWPRDYGGAEMWSFTGWKAETVRF